MLHSVTSAATQYGLYAEFDTSLSSRLMQNFVLYRLQNYSTLARALKSAFSLETDSIARKRRRERKRERERGGKYSS